MRARLVSLARSRLLALALTAGAPAERLERAGSDPARGGSMQVICALAATATTAWAANRPGAAAGESAPAQKGRAAGVIAKGRPATQMPGFGEGPVDEAGDRGAGTALIYAAARGHAALDARRDRKSHDRRDNEGDGTAAERPVYDGRSAEPLRRRRERRPPRHDPRRRPLRADPSLPVAASPSMAGRNSRPTAASSTSPRATAGSPSSTSGLEGRRRDARRHQHPQHRRLLRRQPWVIGGNYLPHTVVILDAADLTPGQGHPGRRHAQGPDVARQRGL